MSNALSIDVWSTFEAWEADGRRMVEQFNQLPWSLGEWIVEGEKRFGEKAYQGLPETTYTLSSLKIHAWVYERVGERRRDDLSWSHHRQVGALEPQKQARVLEIAANNGWTVARLKEYLNPPKELAEVHCTAPEMPPESPNASSEGDNIETASKAILGAKEAVIDYCRSKESSRWTSFDTDAIELLIG